MSSTLSPVAGPPRIADPSAHRSLASARLLARTYLPRGGPYRDFERPGAVTFFLTAPQKTEAFLVGDFNQWNARATPMTRTCDGHFMVTVPAQARMRYQFAVPRDGSGNSAALVGAGRPCGGTPLRPEFDSAAGLQWAWVADPYAREITWDRHGPQAIFSDDPPFAWHDQRWQHRPLRDLVICELCVRDFSGQKIGGGEEFGTFAGIEAKLDHLVTLGINAIELMPICEFPGDSSWGYNPVFYMAPKWIYGRPVDFKRLVDAAHQRGIAVILDMVFNHAWSDHPYYRMYPPLFDPQGQVLKDNNPFFHHHNNDHANGWGGLDWDHSSPFTTAYMQDVVRFWLHEYHVDGFRFDWLGGVEFDPWQPHRASFDPFVGIAPIARAAREAQPACYLIGEYWPIHGTNPAKTAARLVRETEIDAVWNGAFHHALEACLFQTWQWEKQDIPNALGGFRAQGFGNAEQAINYVVSHDERRPEHEIQFWGAHIAWCDAEPAPYASCWDLALCKARLGLVILMTSPGVPMLYAGQEFGEDSPRTIEFWPLDWKKLALPQGQAQFEFYRRMLRLRAVHPALRSDCVEFYWDDFATLKIVRYKRWDGRGDVVVVAANFDCVTQRVGLGFPYDGEWREAIGGESFQVQGHWHDFTLPPWSAVILTPSSRFESGV